MRKVLPVTLEEARIRHGQFGSDSSYGSTGAFRVQGPCGRKLIVISGGSESEFGWEHVSVSGERRPPNWEEMSFVKNLFWTEEEAVMQLHPPKSQYVNFHENCLHLWRPMRGEIPLPPSILVGPTNGAPHSVLPEVSIAPVSGTGSPR